MLLLGMGLWGAAGARAGPDMENTKHNLSITGPGPVRALTETRICVFCHTPHNGTPQSPLWNKKLEPKNYKTYTSPTLNPALKPLPQPSGPTKLCLSCHDGTIAMGAVVNPAGGIKMAGSDMFPPGSLSNFGLDLSGHHPVSFLYSDALPNPELVTTLPNDLVFGGEGEVHCITCHDPHDDTNGRFLLKDNRYSALCISCHQIPGWAGSKHATSTDDVSAVLPRPPKTWPTYTQLNEWGCEVCHTPHFAPTAEQLLNFTSDPPNPYACTTTPGCHGSAPPPDHILATALAGKPRVEAAVRVPSRGADIAGQTRKISAHHQPPPGTPPSRWIPSGAGRAGIRSVRCEDCHNPHIATDLRAEAPYASGLVRGVSGVDRNGAELDAVTLEYEICFKCHADNTSDLAYVPRVVPTTNLRLAFAPDNPSYHPVLSPGKNLNVPSIPSSFEPSMRPSVVIYCTACHSDDEGTSRGPHGSSFAPILRERYETTDHTPENYDNYALCYRCHDQSSILSDESFGKKAGQPTASGGGHGGHLAAGAPCSACHDAHGVNSVSDLGSETGSHTHLINFDTRIVQPMPGKQYPVFKDSGVFSGACSLVCHGVVHDNFVYP